MNNKNLEVPPQSSQKEDFAALATNVVGVIGGLISLPLGIGAGLGSIMVNEYKNHRIGRRLIGFYEDLVEAYSELQVRVDGLEDRSQSEHTATITFRAFQIAISTHQEEKLEALRNAVLNSLLPIAPDEDMQMIYLQWIEVFTPSHLKVLQELQELAMESFAYSSEKDTQHSAFARYFPVLEKATGPIWYIIADLEAKGLLTLQVDNNPYSISKTRSAAPSLSPIGREFLDFIFSPIEKIEGK